MLIKFDVHEIRNIAYLIDKLKKHAKQEDDKVSIIWLEMLSNAIDTGRKNGDIPE